MWQFALERPSPGCCAPSCWMSFKVIETLLLMQLGHNNGSFFPHMHGGMSLCCIILHIKNVIFWVSRERNHHHLATIHSTGVGRPKTWNIHNILRCVVYDIWVYIYTPCTSTSMYRSFDIYMRNPDIIIDMY